MPSPTSTPSKSRLRRIANWTVSAVSQVASHTGSAVSQAISHTGSALSQVVSQTGSILRTGNPAAYAVAAQGISLAKQSASTAFDLAKSLVGKKQEIVRKEQEAIKTTLSSTEITVSKAVSGAATGTLAAGLLWAGASPPVVVLTVITLLPSRMTSKVTNRLKSSFPRVANLLGTATTFIPSFKEYGQIACSTAATTITGTFCASQTTKKFHTSRLRARLFLYSGLAFDIAAVTILMSKGTSRTTVSEYTIDSETILKVTDTEQCTPFYCFPTGKEITRFSATSGISETVTFAFIEKIPVTRTHTLSGPDGIEIQKIHEDGSLELMSRSSKIPTSLEKEVPTLIDEPAVVVKTPEHSLVLSIASLSVIAIAQQSSTQLSLSILFTITAVTLQPSLASAATLQDADFVMDDLSDKTDSPKPETTPTHKTATEFFGCDKPVPTREEIHAALAKSPTPPERFNALRAHLSAQTFCYNLRTNSSDPYFKNMVFHLQHNQNSKGVIPNQLFPTRDSAGKVINIGQPANELRVIDNQFVALHQSLNFDYISSWFSWLFNPAANPRTLNTTLAEFRQYQLPPHVNFNNTSLPIISIFHINPKQSLTPQQASDLGKEINKGISSYPNALFVLNIDNLNDDAIAATKEGASDLVASGRVHTYSSPVRAKGAEGILAECNRYDADEKRGEFFGAGDSRGDIPKSPPDAYRSAARDCGLRRVGLDDVKDESKFIDARYHSSTLGRVERNINQLCNQTDTQVFDSSFCEYLDEVVNQLILLGNQTDPYEASSLFKDLYGYWLKDASARFTDINVKEWIRDGMPDPARTQFTLLFLTYLVTQLGLNIFNHISRRLNFTRWSLLPDIFSGVLNSAMIHWYTPLAIGYSPIAEILNLGGPLVGKLHAIIYVDKDRVSLLESWPFLLQQLIKKLQTSLCKKAGNEDPLEDPLLDENFHIPADDIAVDHEDRPYWKKVLTHPDTSVAISSTLIFLSAFFDERYQLKGQAINFSGPLAGMVVALVLTNTLHGLASSTRDCLPEECCVRVRTWVKKCFFKSPEPLGQGVTYDPEALLADPSTSNLASKKGSLTSDSEDPTPTPAITGLRNN